MVFIMTNPEQVMNSSRDSGHPAEELKGPHALK